MAVIIIILFFIIQSPVYSFIEYDRAIYKAQKGDWGQSQELLKKVLIEKPDNADVLYDMGVGSFKNKEYDKALSYFNKATQSLDASPSLREQAYFNSGNAHVQLKQLQEAIDAYDQALALNPTNERAAHNKEIVKKMLEQQKQEQEKEQEKNKEQEKEKDNKQDNNKKKENQKNEEQNKQDQQPEQENKDQNDNQQQQQQDQKRKNEQPEQNKKQQEQKKEDAKQSQQTHNEKKEKEEQETSQASNTKQQQASNNSEQKLSPALARILDEREKKDAELNKKMMRAMAHTQGGSSDDYNCW